MSLWDKAGFSAIPTEIVQEFTFPRISKLLSPVVAEQS
jgi:hypothetical protein